MIPDLSAVRVAVIGDSVLDHYVIGTVARVSPEAPVPVLRVEERRAAAGGAANVAVNAAALGAGAALVSFVGRDDAGRQLTRLCSRAGVTMATIGVEATVEKARYVARDHHLLRVDDENVPAAPKERRDALRASALAQIARADAVVLSDYGKGALCDAMIAATITECRERRVPVVVDPKGDDFSRYAGATVLTPNAAELSRVSGRNCSSDDACEAACHWILREIDGIGAVLCTRGPQGMTLVSFGREGIHIPTSATKVVDVAGAGDTVAAALACGLGAGLSVEEAARFASIAAGVVVGKAGTSCVSRSELRDADGARGDGKIVEIDDAIARCAAWRARGLRVGFANGCFDVFHAGHAKLLREARGRCDRLVVAINSDALVTALKGPGRPIHRAEHRADVLAALAAVDAVTIFDDETPLGLIEALRPDLLFKGSDYFGRVVVGSDLVAAWEGATFLVDYEPRLSTSAVIAALEDI
jgi:D-beta-D-heptose 7-phosphate kinase / D-beta-D-heptose 1-phosphate adenosyltransferase